MADALGLMQRMGYMVGESALLENPLAIRYSQGRKRQKREGHEEGLFHRVQKHDQNLTETDRRAAPNAPAVTKATGPCAAAMPWTFSPLLFCSKAMAPRIGVRIIRSEEHTSELQSLRHLVCRLLL